jgi:hypothetical protein
MELIERKEIGNSNNGFGIGRFIIKSEIYFSVS